MADNEGKGQEIEKLKKWIADLDCSSERPPESPELYCLSLLNKIMKDPVRLSNGQVCARWMIEPWLGVGQRICPLTNEKITDELTPCDLPCDMILQWAKKLQNDRKEIRIKEGGIENINSEFQKWMLDLEISPLDQTPTPEVYCFNLLNRLMKIPVKLSNGQVYDRRMIIPLLEQGSTKCPLTNDIVTEVLTPYEVPRDMILRWGQKLHTDYQISTAFDVNDGFPRELKEELMALLQLITSDSFIHQNLAARLIREKTKEPPKEALEYRVLFAKIPNAISYLLKPLLGKNENSDHGLRTHIVTALLNLALVEKNRKIIAETEYAINVLSQSLLCKTNETLANAAQAICQLGKGGDSISAVIGQSGVISSLVNLLGEKDPMDFCAALATLSNLPENRKIAHTFGVINVMKTYLNPDNALYFTAIMVSLSKDPMGVKDFICQGGLPLVLDSIKVLPADGYEGCIQILLSICQEDEEMADRINKVQEVYGMIDMVKKQRTNDRSKNLADQLLKKLAEARNSQVIAS